MMNQQMELFPAYESDSVTTEELDAAVSRMAEAKKEYDAKKKESNEAHAIWQSRAEYVQRLLEKAGKKSYKVDGVGTASIVEKLKVTVPSAPEDKAAFFTWLRETEGVDSFNHYATVNYQSLNSFYNLKYEESENKDTFEIPGLSSPESVKELRFRR